MGLIGHDLMLRYLMNVRVMHIDGYFGSGKTALAFKIADELMKSGEFRYIISNVKSVWNDRIEDVELRDGQFLDAVIILDEAGEFMKTKVQAFEWLSYLRKLRVVLILPSASSPASIVRVLKVARMWDGFSIGLPLWTYKTILDTSYASESMDFKWWKPNEIWGIYDTEGYPADEAGAVLEFIKRSTAQATANAGYAVNRENEQNQLATLGVETMASIEQAIDDINKIQDKTSKTISVLESNKKRRRK